MGKNDLNIENLAGKDLGNPFLVPPGYFRESRERILGIIAEENHNSRARIVFLKTAVYWTGGIAAALMIGFLLFQNLYLKPQKDVRIAQEINWFINYAGPDLNEVSLASFIADEEIELFKQEDEDINLEQSRLLEMTDYNEIYIIERWMEKEKK